MITFEKFYFNFEDEAATHVTVGACGDDWSIEFIGSEDAPVSLVIRMRGRDNFRKLIEQINSMGLGIVQMRESETSSASPYSSSPPKGER